MFLKKQLSFSRTLAFKLTIWYASVFTLSLCAAFALFYFVVARAIYDQTDQELASRMKELGSLLNVNGIEAVKRVVVLEAQAAGEKKIFVRLLYPDGTAFSSSNMSYWKDIAVSRVSIQQLLQGAGRVFETIAIPQRKHKVRILYSVVAPGVLLQLGQSLEQQTRILEAFRKIFILAMSVIVLVAALIGWFMAKRATTGLQAVARTARHITEGDLGRRVPVNEKGDEIDQLAVTFNRMLDRIQALVTNIREISDNIAHDLKSPVTRIRGLAEITLTTGKTLAEYESMAAETIEACDRLLDMINTMLAISKTEAGVDDLNVEPIDLAALIHEACDLFEPMAEDKGVNISCDIPGPCVISGDRRMVQRMTANLIDNAVKYTPSGGSVHIFLTTTENNVVVMQITDTGIGISSSDLPFIFNRFYRCDKSRSQTGAGLGLCLARAVARAHGGDIRVKSEPGSGSTFSVILPIHSGRGITPKEDPEIAADAHEYGDAAMNCPMN
jgi:heavy metal sensor kinase